MSPTDTDQIAWRGPWESSAPDSASHSEAELQRELCPGHVLFGCQARALGHRRDCDDVLFGIVHPSARYAVVHLTFQRETRPEWPSTKLFATLEEFVQLRLLPDAEDYTA